MPNEALGLGAVAVSVVLFGVFAVPTKTADTRDGMFFQFVMACAIFAVATVTHFVRCGTTYNAGLPSAPGAAHSCPQFVPLASFGGALWAMSNVLLVPIVDTIGVGLCMMIWGMCECLAGWGTARAGLFGVAKEPVNSVGLNTAGVVAIFGALLLTIAVQPAVDGAPGATPTEDKPSESSTPSSPLLANAVTVGASLGEGSGSGGGSINGPQPALSTTAQAGGWKWTDALTPVQRRAVGVVLSIVAGTLSGSTFTPPQHVVDATTSYSGPPALAPFPGASTVLLDHFFAHATGIWLTSTTLFAAYLLLARERAFLATPRDTGLFIAAGLIWGLAMVCWFIGNENLSIVVSFPIVTIGPGCVSLLVGAAVFREVRGWRNYALLAVAVCLYVVGAALIVLSKR